MKKIILISFIFFIPLLPGLSVLAADATQAANQKQINDLKDRLATKVAELRQLQRKAIFGTVKAVSASTATIETKTKDVKIELTDDIKIAQIIKGTRTKLTADNLDKGDQVAVFGEFDATLDLLKAKVIFIQAAPTQRIAGMVTDTSKADFTLTVKTPEGKNYIVDIETVTKIAVWTADKGITKGGFSKVTVGDTIHVIGMAAKTDDRISASRILDLGNLTGTAPAATASPTVKPTP
ncbi:MAG: hypothetical protein AAB457_02240 [Patescibacteria group bacterium]